VRVAVDVVGTDVVRQALPRLQKLALRTSTREAMAKQKGLLGDLQSEVQEATSVESVEYEEIARFRPRTLLSFGVFAVALYALAPRLAEISDVGATLGRADWVWLGPMVVCQLLTYVGAAFALNGSVPNRIKFFPSFWAQVAAAFVDILAPASIGGMALNTRYLQKRGVDAGVAVAGVGLHVVAGFVAHVALVAAFLVWVGSGAGGESSVEGSETIDASVGIIALIVLAVVAALAGIAIAIPPTRRILQARVVPIVRDARTGIVDLARNPRKLLGLFGGSGLITLGLLAAFYFSVLAFGGDVPFPTLAVTYLIASALAMIAPTPGGVGAVEAALIATLIRLGMDADASVSAVFLFRTVTFWLPVLPGWISFQVMQRKNYI
jgi:undecaprenyl-diphosphatase